MNPYSRVDVFKRKNSCSYRNSNPGPSGPSYSRHTEAGCRYRVQNSVSRATRTCAPLVLCSSTTNHDSHYHAGYCISIPVATVRHSVITSSNKTNVVMRCHVNQYLYLATEYVRSLTESMTSSNKSATRHHSSSMTRHFISVTLLQ